MAGSCLGLQHDTAQKTANVPFPVSWHSKYIVWRVRLDTWSDLGMSDSLLLWEEGEVRY